MEIDVIREIKHISINNKHRFNFIAKYIMEHITDLPKISIGQLAKETYSSQSTINRFTKFLHLSGYKELVHIIKYFNYTLIDTDQIAKEVTESHNLYQRYIDVVDNIKKTFDLFIAQEKNAEIIVSKLKTVKRINIFAVGGTYNFAKDFEQKLLRLGLNVISVNNYHDGYFLVTQSNKEILSVFISYSGETQDLISLALICKTNSSQVIAITKNNNNTLARIADYKMEISSNDSIIRVVSFTHRLALIFCLDMILYKLIFSNFNDYKILLEKTALTKI